MTSKIHQSRLEDIANDPRKACIYHPYKVEMEVPIIDLEGMMLTQIDLLVYAKEGLFVVEYKCHDSVKQREKAYTQLLIGQANIERIRGKVHPTLMWYVHGDPEEKYHAERLLPVDKGYEWYVIR